MRLVFDIEGNGLYWQADTIWCICAKDIDTGNTYEWSWGSSGYPYDGFVNSVLDEADELIGHNIINYDLPVLKKLTGWTPRPEVKITDTLILSRLLYPDRPKPYGYLGKGGPHSLECWGHRVGLSKIQIDDWTQFDLQKVERCWYDVRINHLTYNELQKEIQDGDWKESINIELLMAKIMTDQEHRGIGFDEDQAVLYVALLDRKIKEIDEEIVPLLPKTLVDLKPIMRPFLKTGGYCKRAQSYIDEAYKDYPDIIRGPFTRIRFVDFDLGSTERVKSYLLDSGWKPEVYNYSQKTGERTSPKLEGDFDGVDGEIPNRVKERITWRHRKSQIEGWLGNLRPDKRLSAGANTCGANTGRMHHNTVVNIPKSNENKEGNLIWDTDKQKVIFGTQMRSLFIPREGFKLVGHDASGIELRMLAHYMNDPEFTRQILEGDIHTYIQNLIGLDDRNTAKTLMYALIYGGGNEKIGYIVGGDARKGKEIKDLLFERLPKLGKLVERVQRAAGRGYLIGLDGRKLYIRRGEDGRLKRNTALNVLLQAAAAIVMKKSCILLWEDVEKHGIEAYKVLDMHDEGQSEVNPKDVELYCELAVLSIKKAGEYFKLNIPLDGEAKVGNNMAETH